MSFAAWFYGNISEQEDNGIQRRLKMIRSLKRDVPLDGLPRSLDNYPNYPIPTDDDEEYQNYFNPPQPLKVPGPRRSRSIFGQLSGHGYSTGGGERIVHKANSMS